MDKRVCRSIYKPIQPDHSSPPSSSSEVQRVRLSRMSCMMVVASLYCSSSIWSMSAMASSKAFLASWQATLGSFLTSQWNTEQFRARPSLMGWVVLSSASAMSVAALQALWALSPAASWAAPEVYSEMYRQQSPFILWQKTLASGLAAFWISWLSMRVRISLQYLLSSPSILALQPLRSPKFLDPLCSSFFSIELRALQAVLRDPMVFLQATESKFLSSTVKSALALTTLFMASSMSSNLSVCSVILAMQIHSSLLVAVIFQMYIKFKNFPQFKLKLVAIINHHFTSHLIKEYIQQPFLLPFQKVPPTPRQLHCSAPKKAKDSIPQPSQFSHSSTLPLPFSLSARLRRCDRCRSTKLWKRSRLLCRFSWAGYTQKS